MRVDNVQVRQMIEDLEALDMELGCVSSDRVAEALESRRQGLLRLLGSQHPARRRMNWKKTATGDRPMTTTNGFADYAVTR